MYSIRGINYIGMLGNIVSILAYSLILISIWIIFSTNILNLFKSKDRLDRFRGSLKSENGKTKSELHRHMEKLMSTTLNTKSQTIIYGFYILTFLIFVFSMALISRQSSIVITIVFSVIFSALPYIFLQLKLSSIRIEGSYEGEMLVAELINQYKINYFNMIEAIDHSIKFLSDSKYSQKILFRLSLALKQYKNDEELQETLDDFTYSINTEWIKMLSNNIHLAVEDGTNVSNALEDILRDLRDAKKNLEASKRLNNEGFAIFKFASVGFYLGSIYISIKHFDFTINKFIDYQINTELGFKFFLIIITLTIVNYSIIVMFKRQKFDF